MLDVCILTHASVVLRGSLGASIALPREQESDLSPRAALSGVQTDVPDLVGDEGWYGVDGEDKDGGGQDGAYSEDKAYGEDEDDGGQGGADGEDKASGEDEDDGGQDGADGEDKAYGEDKEEAFGGGQGGADGEEEEEVDGGDEDGD